MEIGKEKGKVTEKKKEGERDTEKLILAAAKRVFTRKGMYGTRMQEIANEAGINKSLLHYYYRSKSRLFNAVFQEAFSKFFPVVLGIMESVDLSFEDKIRAIVTKYIDEFKNREYLPLFIINEIQQNPLLIENIGGNISKITSSKFVAQLQEGISKGYYRPVILPQLMLNILSLTMFPIIAKPMVSNVFGISDKAYLEFLEERKQIIPELIIQNLIIK